MKVKSVRKLQSAAHLAYQCCRLLFWRVGQTGWYLTSIPSGLQVLPCSKRYCHDWTTCPFAHPGECLVTFSNLQTLLEICDRLEAAVSSGEKARRRDPRVFNYTGIACPDMKKVRGNDFHGQQFICIVFVAHMLPRRCPYTHRSFCVDVMQEGACPRREACPYAHNVFEYWLHPTRYRTQLCNDDNRCKRRICFFAHTLEELRVPSCKPFVPPEALAAATPPDAVTDASGSPSEWSPNFGIPKVGSSFHVLNPVIRPVLSTFDLHEHSHEMFWRQCGCLPIMNDHGLAIAQRACLFTDIM